MDKNIAAVGAIIIGILTMLFGVPNAILYSLLALMAIDWITGIITAWRGKSAKTASGTLSSEIGAKGLLKKALLLLCVIVGHIGDILLNLNFIRDGVCFTFIFNELVSITENLALNGVKMPAAIIKMIDIIKQKGDNGNDTD